MTALTRRIVARPRVTLGERKGFAVNGRLVALACVVLLSGCGANVVVEKTGSDDSCTTMYGCAPYACTCAADADCCSGVCHSGKCSHPVVGGNACFDYLSNPDPTKSDTWGATLVQGNFANPSSWKAYDALNQCACTWTGPCGRSCDSYENSTGKPDFCNDTWGSSECASCLSTKCASEVRACLAN
jgi:hypothetical protein